MKLVDCGQFNGVTNRQYVVDYIQRAVDLLDVDALGVKSLKFVRLSCRARWYERTRSVLMDLSTRSFQPDYRGYKYKTFGGKADLTPAGVFLHECGHALSFRHHSIIKKFRALRKRKRKSITGYGTGNVYEDIAECFRLYVSNGALLQELAPERYEIMDKYARQYLK